MSPPRLSTALVGNLSVGTSAVPVPTNASSPKEVIALYNMSAGKLYWGTSAAVTAATGFPVLPSFTADFGGPVWLIADTAAQDVRYVVFS